jgi:multiple sugar transport system substrate-binding protein
MRNAATRMLTVLIMLLIAGTVFATGDIEPASTGPVDIEFWTTETQSDRQATIQVLIDTFEILNPDITIELIPVEENDLATQMAAAAAAGNLPAFAEIPAETAVALGVEGLLDVGATTDFVNTFGKSRFYQGALELVGTGSGRDYYAIPYHGWIQGIWYRSDWFEEAGLAAPNTWESILAAAKYFNNPRSNQYGILVGTTAEAFTEQCFTQFARSNGAGLFDKDGNLVFNSPEMREAIEYYAELAKYTPPGPQTWRARDYYLQGKMAMFFYSTYIMDDLAVESVASGSLTGDNFEGLEGTSFDPELVANTRLASIITNDQPAGYGVVVSLAFPDQGDAAKTAAAQKFLQYLFTPNAYVTFLHMAPGGMNPVLPEVTSNPRFLNDPKGVYSHYGPEKLAEIIGGLESIQSFGIVEGNRIDAAALIFAQQILPQMLYAITQEGVDIDVAMAAAEDAMRDLME